MAILDAGGLRTDLKLTVRVMDVPERPTGLLLNGATFSELQAKENSKGVVLGTLSAVDEDKAKSQHNFSATAPLKVEGASLMVNPSSAPSSICN